MWRLFLLLVALITTVSAQVQTKLGALRHGAVFELSIIFGERVDVASLVDRESYSVTIGELIAARLTATNYGAILSITNVQENMQGLLNISGVKDERGTNLPLTSLTFDTGSLFWTTNGGNELRFGAEVTSIGTNGFDIFSGGIQQRDDYDESTFVGEAVTGDFERRVRVSHVDAAGWGAKAGIMAREFLDEGRRRPLNPFDPQQSLSRYVELSVAAPASAVGEPGHNQHQIWMRERGMGVITRSLAVTNDAAPTFPDVWLQMKRRGQVFEMSRSIDGIAWEDVGSARFPETMPATIYAGLAFSPQNDDLSPLSGARKRFVAKFREFARVNESHSIAINDLGEFAELTWEGFWFLETAPTVTGEWTDAPSQENPQRVEFTEPARFFRLRR